MRFLFCMLIIMAIVVPVAQGQNPVSASISKDQVAANETFTITISASGGDIKEPDLSAVIGAGIQLGSPSHQSSTSIRSVQGATTVVQSRTWRYPASIDQEGLVTIPRIPVTVDGQEYFTPPMNVEVTRGLRIDTRQSEDRDELTVEELALVRSIADKTTVYQGEAVTLRLRLYVLDQYYVNVDGPRALPMPKAEGFYTGPQGQQTATEQVYGRPYRINEFTQVLYPTMPGDLEIGAWNWQGAIRWRDARRRAQGASRVFSTNPIPIKVLPLPSAPEHFSGAVGTFQVDAKLTETMLTQGTPVRYTVTVSGTGNPNAIGAPAAPELPWAHLSGPEVEIEQRGGATEVIKEFSWLITPLNTGEYTIPAVEYVHFAPPIRNFRTVRTREFDVAVQAAPESGEFIAVGGAAEEQRSRIQVFEDGLTPIITDYKSLTASAGPMAGPLRWPALFSPVASLFLLGAVGIILRQRDRLRRDSGYARRYYAKRRCLQQLAAVSGAPDGTDRLYQAMTTFVADMLNVNAAGLTSSDVAALLREKDIEPALISVVARLLRACERARYAGRQAASEEVEALYDAATDAVHQLHDGFREVQS